MPAIFVHHRCPAAPGELNEAEANLPETKRSRQREANLVRIAPSRNTPQSQAAVTPGFSRRVVDLEGAVRADGSNAMRSSGSSAHEAAIRSVSAIVAAKLRLITQGPVELHIHPLAINGRTGNLAIKQGNIIQANHTDLTTINR